MAFSSYSSSDWISSPVLNIRNFLLDNITDPIASTRPTGEKFVFTSYPQRPVRYPIITIKLFDFDVPLSQGATNSVHYVENMFEIKVWARNEIEKDRLTQSITNALRGNQFSDVGGSVVSGMYDFKINSILPVESNGENALKLQVINISYSQLIGQNQYIYMYPNALLILNTDVNPVADIVTDMSTSVNNGTIKFNGISSYSPLVTVTDVNGDSFTGYELKGSSTDECSYIEGTSGVFPTGTTEASLSVDILATDTSNNKVVASRLFGDKLFPRITTTNDSKVIVEYAEDKTINNSAGITDITITNGGMVFNGSSSSIRIENSAQEVIRNNNQSVSVWFSITGSASTQRIFSHPLSGTPGNRIYISRTATNKIGVTVGNVNPDGTALSIDTDYNVVVTIDRTNLLFYWYLNGVLQNAGGTAFTYSNSWTDFYFGSLNGGAELLNGTIYQGTIHNRLLSQSDITSIVNAGKDSICPVRDSILLEYSGKNFAGTPSVPTTIYDTSNMKYLEGDIVENEKTNVLVTLGETTTGTDGTVSGGVTISDGAMVFGGSSGYIYGTSFPFIEQNKAFSFSFFISVNEDGDGYIFGNIEDNITKNIAFGWRNTNSRIEGAMFTSGTPNIYKGRFATPTLNKGQLYHITIVYDGTTLGENTNGVDVWVDGIKQSKVSTNFGSAGSTNMRFAIGAQTQGGSYFKGSIIQFLVFNRGISQSEITSIVNAGKDAYSPIRTGLVAEYSGKNFAGTPSVPTSITDTAGAGEQKLYINGEVADSDVNYIPTYAGGTSTYLIGTNPQLTHNNNNLIVSLPMIFNRILTDSEIDDLIENPSGVYNRDLWN